MNTTNEAIETWTNHCGTFAAHPPIQGWHAALIRIQAVAEAAIDAAKGAA